MTNNLLSVIVPVFNAGNYLISCIQSIINQTYKSLEILLIDDGSTDGSSVLLDHLASKDERIKVYHRKNEGVSSARNYGIEKSCGDLIAFVDADDALDKKMYEILINALNNTNSDVSACTYSKEKSNSILNLNFSSIPQPEILIGGGIYESITRKNHSIEGYVWNKVYRRNVIGNHRFKENISMCEDSIFTWETLKDANTVCFVNLPLYHYSVLQNSSTNTSSFSRCLTALDAYEYMLNDAKSISQQCVDDLAIQYLIWNLISFQRLVKEDNHNEIMYNRIRNNCIMYSKYLPETKKTVRFQIDGIIKGYRSGEIAVNIIQNIKKIIRK